MLSMNGIIVCELILGTVSMSLIFATLADTDLIADTSSKSKNEMPMPVRYLWNKIAGEGIIKHLSLSGSYITGNRPVSVGMALALQIFVPWDPEPLWIDRATVKWVKGSEFGMDFDTLLPNVAERLTKIVSMMVNHNMAPAAMDKRVG